jgi:hypothetical protein
LEGEMKVRSIYLTESEKLFFGKKEYFFDDFKKKVEYFYLKKVVIEKM